MENKNMTALVSCFARCYHFKNNKFRVYSDAFAGKILSDEEFKEISSYMAQGIKFFNPNFVGSDEEALRYIVDNQLSPSVLGRSAFCQDKFTKQLNLGLKQYLIFASGYDTSAYKYIENDIETFEIDRKEMIQDKVARIDNANIPRNNVSYISTDFTDTDWTASITSSKYVGSQRAFCSLNGISYYLSKGDFKNMLQSISAIITDGSGILFDYPTYAGGTHSRKNEELAAGANETMQAKYSYEEIEKLLATNGFEIAEHLNDEEMTNRYFCDYNRVSIKNRMVAPKGVAYCYAVKKTI